MVQTLAQTVTLLLLHEASAEQSVESFQQLPESLTMSLQQQCNSNTSHDNNATTLYMKQEERSKQERSKQERSRQGQTNTKAKQHSTPKAVSCLGCTCMYVVA